MGKGISPHSRDLVRPFAGPLGDLIDVFHGRVFDLDPAELRSLEAAVKETLEKTDGHKSGRFHLAAKLLEPFVRDAIEHYSGLPWPGRSGDPDATPTFEEGEGGLFGSPPERGP